MQLYYFLARFTSSFTYTPSRTMSNKPCMNGMGCRYLTAPNPKTGMPCPFVHTQVSVPVATSDPVAIGYAEYLRQKAETEAIARAQADPGYVEFLRQKAQAQQVPAKKTPAQPSQGNGKGKTDGAKKPNPKAGTPDQVCRNGTEAECAHFKRDGTNGCNRQHGPKPVSPISDGASAGNAVNKVTSMSPKDVSPEELLKVLEETYLAPLATILAMGDNTEIRARHGALLMVIAMVKERITKKQ
jgi:hypothetical protein